MTQLGQDAPHGSLAERAIRRAAALDVIRAFFKERGFVEVDTPILLTAPAPEPQLEAPAVDLVLPAESGRKQIRRYLQTSPELPMKRLLAAGLTNIFQIAPTFREGELGPVHRPEFRMLEWYRRQAGYEALLEDCQGLLARLAEAHGPQPWTYRGAVLDVRRPFLRMTVEEAFVRYAGFSLLATLSRDGGDAGHLRRELERLGVHALPTDTWDDLFHRVFLSRVEPALARSLRPLFLTHYPAPLAALARLSPDDPRVAERFELYLGGLELANGFGELCDPDEQRRRFVTDREARRLLGRHDYPLDERFLQTLGAIERAAGIALGIDRLLMIFLGAEDLDGAGLIPWLDA